MRLVYLGTPDMAVPPLQALHAVGHEIALVVSGADKRRGRRGTATPSPVKAAALELGLPVTDDPDDVLSVEADLGVVVAYGRLLRPHLLAALDMVNVHFSLLPRWRGAAPVERALLAGDAVTGVCLMKVEEGLDTGCVYRSAEVPIRDDWTAVQLRHELVQVGTAMLVDALGAGLGRCTPQSDRGVTYAAKLGTDDLRLDWSATAEAVLRTIRVGGAWTTFGGDRFKVHAARALGEDPDAEGPAAPGTVSGDQGSVRVRAGDGVLELISVQPAGKPSMRAGDWANGARPFGVRLGAERDDAGAGS